jgi:FkbH-like protein
MEEISPVLGIISDFNTDNLIGAFKSNNANDLKLVSAGFGQVSQILLDRNSLFWEKAPKYALVWTRPEVVCDSYRRALEYEYIDLKEILEEVDNYCILLNNLAENVDAALIPCWVDPRMNNLDILIRYKSNYGSEALLLEMNRRLIQNLSKDVFYILDSKKWLQAGGRSAYQPKLWAMAKIPFSNEVFKEAANDICHSIIGIRGQSKKLLILDLDDTLWGGIVGDVGWKNLKLGGHDPIGESFVEFQKKLKGLARSGIILGIVSKNEEHIALEAIKNHPEMVLSLDDFAGWKINWNDKAQNVAELVDDLNLGLDSVIFIDDNPVERARVRESLTDVFVPEWPTNKLLYSQALASIGMISRQRLTEEDSDRTKMYASERTRNKLKKNVGSLEEWLKSLDMSVIIDDLSDVNFSRTWQLLNKTNQMNLATRRLSERELRDWASVPNKKIWIVQVSDKFGDSGITGIISLCIAGSQATLVDFILSCRVMGRQVEKIMLLKAIDCCKELGIRKLKVEYKPTPKNLPCYRFFKEVLTQEQENIFFWELSDELTRPNHVKIVDNTWN